VKGGTTEDRSGKKGKFLGKPRSLVKSRGGCGDLLIQDREGRGPGVKESLTGVLWKGGEKMAGGDVGAGLVVCP